MKDKQLTITINFINIQYTNETVIAEVMDSILTSLAVHVWHHNFMIFKKSRTQDMESADSRLGYLLLIH